MRRAAGLAATTRPFASATMMPSSTASMTVLCSCSTARRSSSARRRSVVSAHTTTKPVWSPTSSKIWRHRRAHDHDSCRRGGGAPTRRRARGVFAESVGQADEVVERRADRVVARDAVDQLGGAVPALDPAVRVDADDRVGDVLDEVRLVAQRGFGALAVGEVAQDHLVRVLALPARQHADRLDHPRRAVEAHERGFRRFGDGGVLGELAMRSSVGPSESGWTKSMIERPSTSSTLRAPTHSIPDAVHVDDAAALVHDDAVGAQVDEAAVAVDELPQVRLDEVAVADVDDEAGEADDLAAPCAPGGRAPRSAGPRPSCSRVVAGARSRATVRRPAAS